MSDVHSTYNNYQQPGMTPPPYRRTRMQAWRDRMMQRYGTGMTAPVLKGAMTIPNWLTGKAMVFFFVSMLACWMVFGYVPGFDLILTAGVSVVLFFYGGISLSKKWSNTKEKRFLRNVFIAGFFVRLLWMLYCYYVFNPEYYGNTYGDTADVDWYMGFGKDLTQWIRGESKLTLSELIDIDQAAIDDVGYPMWLGVIYFVVGVDNDIFVPFLIKCLLSAYCAICIYRVAKRHFGEGAARMAAIFICLNPNMIYWSASMMKETEMVFLCCLAIDNFDRVLSSGNKFTFKSLLPGILAGAALMFIRSALGMVVFLAVFAHIVMASSRVMSWGKKIIAGALVGAVLMIGFGDRIMTQSEALIEDAQSAGRQEKNLEFRANREGGNSFAKYAGTAVFAPLIFTIPFPTYNQAEEDQLIQVQLTGGSYIKNVLSFFVILVMFLLLISGQWRQHVFILAYTVGYHLVLVMSNFAQSGRFHMPVIPMLMLFAAYGIQLAKGNAKLRKWFPIVLIAEVVICIAWNWFKLKGRGMI